MYNCIYKCQNHDIIQLLQLFQKKERGVRKHNTPKKTFYQLSA